MKALKLIFAVLFLVGIVTSCTPDAIEDEQIQTEATGDSSGQVNDGSKD